MHRLLILFTIIVAALAMLAMPASSFAWTDSTCTVHDLGALQWSVQDDTVDTAWDFKCGGSNNEDWAVGLYLQWRDSQSNWHTFNCDNGLPCYTIKPASGPPFPGGSEHSGINHWNIAGQIDCQYIRLHSAVVFYKQTPTKYWNSQTYHVGSC